MTPLQGRRALVTGGAKGIGRAIAARLAADGAALVILGRDAAALREAGEALGAEQVVVDVARPGALAAAIAGMGAIDILVNNAGAAISQPFAKSARADWEAMLSVNLLSVLEGCQAALPGMIGRGWGRIVNVASTAGLKGYAYTVGYCAAKHGVIGATRAIALEVARTGVTVNAVCPGFTDTDMAARAMDTISAKTGQSRDDARAALARLSPQNRLVAPEEVAEAVAYLCRDEARSMTGQSIAVAGGEVM